jgi:hypothetical protein
MLTSVILTMAKVSGNCSYCRKSNKEQGKQNKTKAEYQLLIPLGLSVISLVSASDHLKLELFYISKKAYYFPYKYWVALIFKMFHKSSVSSKLNYDNGDQTDPKATINDIPNCKIVVGFKMIEHRHDRSSDWRGFSEISSWDAYYAYGILFLDFFEHCSRRIINYGFDMFILFYYDNNE